LVVGEEHQQRRNKAIETWKKGGENVSSTEDLLKKIRGKVNFVGYLLYSRVVGEEHQQRRNYTQQN